MGRPTEPILNAQLASLVGKVARRRGEIAGDFGPPVGDRPRKRVKGKREAVWCAEWRGWAPEPGRQGDVPRVEMWRAMGER